MTQIGRNVTDAEDGCLAGNRLLIHDRDPLFGAAGLNNTLIAPTIASIGKGRVRCRERLGGLLKFYYRAAA